MKVVLILSGGMDSRVLLSYLKTEGHDVHTLSVDYGQRHSVELQYAEEAAREEEVSWELADLRGIKHLLGGSALTSDDIPVPDGHYAEDSMKATVVPNRNMILLSVAIGYAISIGAEAVAYGAHAGDHTIYPDCREEFAEAMQRAALLCDWKEVKLMRPFVALGKHDVASIGSELGVDFTKTWSCYKGGDIHCGSCGTCVERREAMTLAGIVDRTPYLSLEGLAS